MLARQQAPRQVVRAFAGLHRHPYLRDHRAGIQFRHHEMHAGAVLGVACRQGLGVGVQPAVLGQQRGVDVEQASAETLHDAGAEDAHVAGADHPVRLRRGDGVAQRLVERSAVGEGLGLGRPAAVRRHHRQRRRFGAIAEHADHLGIQGAGGDRGEDGLQVGAAAGSEHGEAKRHRTGFRNRAPTAGRCSVSKVAMPSAVPSGKPKQVIAAPA